MISVVMINSRGDAHPDWVQQAINSVEKQTVKHELIVIDNRDRSKTIGECWNIGVKESQGEWVFFLGDDDFIATDYLACLSHYIEDTHAQGISTYMTAFNEESKQMTSYTNPCTGMWRRKYLLENPFNEKLKSGVDREFWEEQVKKGTIYMVIHHNYGYYYRKHDDYSCAGELHMVSKPSEIYVLASASEFIKPVVGKLKEEGRDVFLSRKGFEPILAQEAKIIWCEWANEAALKCSQFDCDARKFLRIHAFEVFNPIIHYIDFSKFEKVIFVANHIKSYLETVLKKIPNAVVIPNGVEIDKYTIADNKQVNNKIAYAGYITRKKGVGEMIMMAHSMPEYEFHVAGKFQENDTADYFHKMKPKNVFMHPWQYDYNEWLKDKTYVLNTSIRESQGMSVMEGMSAGCMPVVRNWVGASDVYKGFKLYNTVDEAKVIMEEPINHKYYRNFVKRNYNFKDSYKQLRKLLD